MVELVCATVGVDCFVGLADESMLLSLSGRCRLGLVDGRPNVKICGLWTQLGLECIIGTKII
jgi:hypothetical protein